MSEKDFEEKYNHIRDYVEKQHRDNQTRIRVGIKVNIIIPLIFLILSFLNSGSKLIFLIFWIISLFGIAFYLMYVEYSDYVLQENMKEFGFVDSDVKNDILLGHNVEAVSDAAIEKADVLDEKIDEQKSAIIEKLAREAAAAKVAISQNKAAAKESIAESKAAVKESIAESKAAVKEKITKSKTDDKEKENDA